MISRRSFMIAGAGAVACAATSHSAFGQNKKIRLQLAWLPNSGMAGEIAALKKGYFAEKGLDVEILPGGPGSNPVQEVMSGVAEVAHAYAPQIMYAANQGLPVKSFAASFQKAPLTFYSLGEANIKSIKDWKGKRIGAAQSATAQIKAILDYNGLTIDQVTFVQAQPPALLQNQVDIVASWPTNVAELELIVNHPSGYNAQAIWDNGLQFQSNYYIATRQTLEGDTETLAGFLEAADKGWSFAADNPAEATELVASMAPGIDKAKELAALEVSVRDYIYNEDTLKYGFGNVDAARWTRTLATYAKIGEIKPDLTTDNVFDDRVLKASNRTKR